MTKTKRELIYENNLPGWNKGIPHSEEHKQKLRDNAKINPNYGMKGKKHSEETKLKISKSRKGKRCGDDNPMKRLETRMKLSKALMGRKSNMKGKTYEEIYGKEKGIEERKKRTGKIRSEETCRKISKGLKGNPPTSGSFTRESRARIKVPLKDSSIEIKIQGFLKELGIKFHKHYIINIKHKYQCDIFIPSMNLVIECDGTYWHNYPRGLERDIIRNKEMWDKGIRVLRFWENEIRLMRLKNLKDKLEVMNQNVS